MSIWGRSPCCCCTRSTRRRGTTVPRRRCRSRAWCSAPSSTTSCPPPKFGVSAWRASKQRVPGSARSPTMSRRITSGSKSGTRASRAASGSARRCGGRRLRHGRGGASSWPSRSWRRAARRRGRRAGRVGHTSCPPAAGRRSYPCSTAPTCSTWRSSTASDWIPTARSRSRSSSSTRRRTRTRRGTRCAGASSETAGAALSPSVTACRRSTRSSARTPAHSRAWGRFSQCSASR
mmetsp:Transcript_16856/g.44245  ORF Transcript_16856/g.44245 Transcript_16856/m.44245 type:complete len:234 (+) Transcript_16856:945-1646(+)